MSKRRILLIALSVIVVVLLIAGAFLTGLIVIPRPTTLTISPSKFLLGPGESIMLKAILQSDSFILSGKTITWSASEGSLDKTTGEAVMYTAPIVAENTSVTIIASFAGDRNYLGSSASAIGFVTPTKAAPTALSITPSTFEVESNGIVTLTATLAPPSAPSSMIAWSLDGPGTLSPAAGASVTYKAPEVKERTKVTIKATFPGTAEYLSSSATCTGYVLPLGVTVRKATTLTISPASFTLKPGETTTLTATLKDVDGNVLTGKIITWSLDGPGRLSSTTGASVTYTAPSEVSEETTVRVTAAFAGDENYTGSSATSIGEVTPVTVVAEEYVLTFAEALLKNAKITGPVTIGGTKATKVTADTIQIRGFNLSRIGLTASNVNITSLEIYVTSIKAYSPELGKTLEISGRETVSLGPYGTLTLQNAIMHIVRMSASTGEFKTIEVVGEYVGGAEPYIPTIIQTSKAELSDGYVLMGPVTYDGLQKAAHSFEVGRAKMLDFSLLHPIKYLLNRRDNAYTSISKWIARTSEASLRNISCILIYLHFKAYGAVEMTLTGEDSTELPYGYNRGTGGMVTDGIIHVVYSKIDEVIVKDFTIEVLPTIS